MISGTPRSGWCRAGFNLSSSAGSSGGHLIFVFSGWEKKFLFLRRPWLVVGTLACRRCCQGVNYIHTVSPVFNRFSAWDAALVRPHGTPRTGPLARPHGTAAWDAALVDRMGRRGLDRCSNRTCLFSVTKPFHFLRSTLFSLICTITRGIMQKF